MTLPTEWVESVPPRRNKHYAYEEYVEQAKNNPGKTLRIGPIDRLLSTIHSQANRIQRRNPDIEANVRNESGLHYLYLTATVKGTPEDFGFEEYPLGVVSSSPQFYDQDDLEEARQG